MNSVLSYILVYYSNISFNVPQNLIDLCKENHPIFANAPEGCGKSWLISMLSLFVHSCIIPNQHPVYLSADVEENLKSEFEINFETPTEGRFGRVLVLVPSGISAAICNGYTFHNALSFSRITMQELTSPISEKKKFTLRYDFFKVQIIVIDEYSMVSLTSLTLLDKVLKEIFPQKSRIPFAGIPVIILGDGFQLPVVKGKGILCRDPHKLSPILSEIYDHFTHKLFYLELSESVRQRNDKRYYETLLRIRYANFSENDVTYLNERYKDDLKQCNIYSVPVGRLRPS